MSQNDLESVVEIDPLKDDRWDAFVEKHPFGWICHHSGWKRVLDQSFGHMKGHYLAIVDGDAIKAALPVYEVKSWLFGNRLVSIPFTTLCDPLVSSQGEMDTLLDAAMNLMRSSHASYIEIKTLSSGGLISNNNLSANPYHKHHYMQLDKPPELLMKKFDRSCVRQKISKALNNNLVLKECKSEEDLKVFHQLHMLTRRERQGLPPKPYVFFKALWDVFAPSNNVAVLLCELDGQTIAGVMLLKFRDRVSIEIAAYETKLVHLSPIHFLFWQSIQMAHKEGYKILDFGSTPPSNQGLMDFKKRWATTVSDLVNYYHPPKELRESERSESMGYKIIQGISRRAPEPVLLSIGRFFYHHLG
jgi:hypothetical protein